MPSWAIAMIVVLGLVALCLALYFIFTVFDGPDGERYQKFRMQGPFVPLSDAEVQADHQRRRAHVDQTQSERGNG